MIRKLPRWIWSGAWALASIAGFVNVVGLLGFEHQTITHLTGTSSMLAVAIAGLNLKLTLHFLAVLGAFLAGCVVSGFIVQDRTLTLHRNYGFALFLEALSLAGAALLMGKGLSSGLYLAAGACGLQNAMVSTYSGAVIRTTHVSGMFTDLGIALGQALRGLPVDTLRLKLCVLIISGFITGGVAGSFLYWRFAAFSLLVPSVLTGLAGFAYRVYGRSHPEAAK